MFLSSPTDMCKKFYPSFALVFLFLGFAFLGGSSAFAQTNYFTWNNSTNTWSSTNAWTPNGGPQSSSSTSNTNVAVFASTGAGNNSVTLGSDRTVYGLVFTTIVILVYRPDLMDMLLEQLKHPSLFGR